MVRWTSQKGQVPVETRGSPDVPMWDGIGKERHLDGFIPSPSLSGEVFIKDDAMSGLDWSGSTFNELLNGIVDSAQPRLLIVTGHSGSGKTIWCGELAHQGMAMGFSVAGLISPAVFHHGQKVGIDLFDLITSERKRLAERRPNLPEHHTGRTWELDPETLSWGNDQLSKSISCQLLVLDELGPLELVENQGLTRGMDLLDAKSFVLACVAVRPSLLANVLDRWPWANYINADKVYV